jgi:alkanesulfonate monooxygenase SsuD/methylene tetrahydromethanopterin reductase-like flavin-dependent oxidoreductase (luciferase family)
VWHDAGMAAASPPQGFGIVLRDPLPWQHELEIVETAATTGYGAVFVPEIAWREAFSTLTEFARAGSGMLLGTGVVTISSRRPQTMAMAAATVQEVSDGRLILGLGAGEWPDRPLGAVREYVRILRELFAGRVITDDRIFGSTGAQLGLQPEVGPPPIWLAALGDGMLRLAGEVADGVVLNWCTAERVAAARRTVTEAAQAAGRDPAEIAISVYVRACLGVEEVVAMDVLRQATAQYAAHPHYRRQFEAMGLGDEAAVAAKAFEAGRPEQVPESLVRTLTVMGGRREAVAHLEAFREAGADLVLCYPVLALDPVSSLLGTVLAAAPSPAIER